MTQTATAGGHQSGVSRVLAKLDRSIETGNYYEALQMYRTLNFRYTAQRKFPECLDLLFDGSLKLVAKQQETSAADLGLLLLDTLEKRGSCDDVDLWVDRLGAIIAGLSASTVERETLINRSVKWSGDMSGNALGHPALHKLIGQVFWNEGNTEQARYHYLLCRDGALCGRILVKISTSKGYIGEVDLFIVQAVLQQLCLKDRKTAEETFAAYTKNHPQIERKTSPFDQPLFNFLHYLFRSIDLGRLDTFRALYEMYRPSLDRDLSFGKYLIKIGVLYLNAPPPANPTGGGLMGGMFGDLFTRLLAGFDGDDDDNEQQQQQREDSGSNELD